MCVVGFDVGRVLIFAGLILVALGALFLIANRLHLPLGRLPGDVAWHSKNTTIYFPVVTCLLVSAVATLLMLVFSRR